MVRLCVMKRFQALAVSCFLVFTVPIQADVVTSPIWSIQFSPDGKYIAAGRYQWVQLWDVKARKVIRVFEPHADAVRCLKFSADGKMLFTGGGLPAESGEFQIWDVESGERIEALEPHADSIEAIAVNADSSKIFTASMDERVSVISFPNAKIERTLTQHVDRVLAVDYSADGKYFVTGGKDKTVKVWDTQTYEVLVNFDQNDAPVYAVSFAPAGNIIVSASADNVLRSWRVDESRAESGRIETDGSLVRVYNGHRAPVYAIDCGVRNNHVIVVSGSADKSVIVWNLRSGNQIYRFRQSTDEVYAVDLGPNGRFLTAGGRDGKIRLWDLVNGEPVAGCLE